MATWHVHARAFSGSLAAPQRNELQSAESDEYEEVEALAEELVGRGFAVWLYRHDHRGTNATAYQVVAEWRATGERVR